MKASAAAIAISCVLLPLTNAESADYQHCVELAVALGKNEKISRSGNNGYERYTNNLCDTYSKFLSDKTAGSVKVAYGLADGSATYTNEKLEQEGKLRCEQNAIDLSNSTQRETFERYLAPETASTVKGCINNATKGIVVKYNYLNQNNGIVVITIANMTGLPLTLKDIGFTAIPPETPSGNVDCKPDNRNMTITTGGKSITCTALSVKGKLEGELQDLVRPGFVVTIGTTANLEEPVTAQLYPIWVTKCNSYSPIQASTLIDVGRKIGNAKWLVQLGWPQAKEARDGYLTEAQNNLQQAQEQLDNLNIAGANEAFNPMKKMLSALHDKQLDWQYVIQSIDSLGDSALALASAPCD